LAQTEADPARAMATLYDALSGGSRLHHVAPSGSAPGAPAMAAAPPLRRMSMAPAGWPAPPRHRDARGLPARLPRHPSSQPKNARDDERRTLTRTATLRRTVFTALVLIQSAGFAYFMATKVLPYHGRQPLELAILSLLTILFVWVSLGFWTALSGFLLLAVGRDRYAITRSVPPGTPIPPEARTAVIMPICNEHVARVFAGLRATYESVAATGTLPLFDFFVLSDSNEPDTLTAERAAWLDLCASVGGFGRIFYRWRRQRIKRKSGNVADFCRRWGSQYRYMIVLDADSIMSGDCLATLVRLMEANPNAGIIQTVPRAAGRDTLYARVQQFAVSVYGPLFTAGLHFWQLGESYYWGHNAIIRIAPFMDHCALGRLRGRGPLSGEIMSHDFVEAALMRRAGWKVWLAYDLPGSYEEMPPSLLDELKRDRRWCKGNLINARLFLWQGLHLAHRAVFMTGIMAYVSAPLWLLSLALSTMFFVLYTVAGPQYFVEPRQLFPVWPEWNVAAAIGLAAGTAAVLFLPKILAAVLLLSRGAEQFGGRRSVTLSLLMEIVFSALLAPVRMLFHAQFVIAALTGLAVPWKSPPREDAETTWREGVRRHGLHTLIGLAWILGVYWTAPRYTWWLLPVAGALAVSILISVYSSRMSWGRALRSAGLFLIPEETEPPSEFRIMRAHLAGAGEAPRFVDAVVDPLVNAAVCAGSPPHVRFSPCMQSRRAHAVTAALQRGPLALTDGQKLFFLTDPVALSQLHFRVREPGAAHPGWLPAEEVGDEVAAAAALPAAS